MSINKPRDPKEQRAFIEEIFTRLGGSFQAQDVNAVTAIIGQVFGYVTFSERHALAYLFLQWAEGRFAMPKRTQMQLDQIGILDAKLEHIALELNGLMDSLDEHVSHDDIYQALNKLWLITQTDVVARPLQAELETKEYRDARRHEDSQD